MQKSAYRRPALISKRVGQEPGAEVSRLNARPWSARSQALDPAVGHAVRDRAARERKVLGGISVSPGHGKQLKQRSQVMQ